MKAAKLIRKARKKLGLSQKQVSESLGLTTSQFVSNVELKKSPIPPERVREFCEILELNSKELISAIADDFKAKYLTKYKGA